MRGPHAYAKRTQGPPARARYNRPTRDQELTGEVLARAGRRRKSPHLFILCRSKADLGSGHAPVAPQ